MEDAQWVYDQSGEDEPEGVLILVVVEDAQWVYDQSGEDEPEGVLILVVVEDAQWAIVANADRESVLRVLILVVVEDAQWGWWLRPTCKEPPFAS